MKEIQLFQAAQRVESALKEGRVFLNAKAGEEQNTMVIGWGYLGVSWGMSTFIALVRKSRHTHAMIREGGVFTVSVAEGAGLEDALALCGKASGRDMDKFAQAGITPAPGRYVDCPVVAQCGLHLECRVAYSLDMDEGSMSAQVARAYPAGDYHTLFFGQVMGVYETE